MSRSREDRRKGGGARRPQKRSPIFREGVRTSTVVRGKRGRGGVGGGGRWANPISSTRNSISLGVSPSPTRSPPTPHPASKYYQPHRSIGASSQVPGCQAFSQGWPTRHCLASSWDADAQADSKSSLLLIVARKLNAKCRRRGVHMRRRE